MSAATGSPGLFDAPLGASGGRRDSDAADGYRSLSGAAIAAGVISLLAPLAFLDWWLLVLPVVGMVLGGVALRDIARRPDVLAGRGLAVAAVGIGAAMFLGGLVWQMRSYAAELPPGFMRMNYAMLQPLPGDPADLIPESAVALDGRDVLLKGYMYPGKQQRGIVQFLLVRDQGDCCFGGNPKITDRVLVQLSDTAGIDFTPYLVKVAGRFRVQPAGTADIAGGVLYHLDAASVR